MRVMIWWAVLLVVGGVASAASVKTEEVTVAEFVGTMPCDEGLRPFVGKLATNDPCHCITWELTLFTNRTDRQAMTYRLVATYGLPGKSDPNQLEQGPTASLKGRWEIIKGSKADPKAQVYRIHPEKSGASLSFIRVGEHLLQLLDKDEKMAIGNAGWSYTLNRKGIGRE